MNYSYVNSEDAASSKGASKNRYKVNYFAGQGASIEEINPFRQFRKFNKFKKSLREANEEDVCYLFFNTFIFSKIFIKSKFTSMIIEVYTNTFLDL